MRAMHIKLTVFKVKTRSSPNLNPEMKDLDLKFDVIMDLQLYLGRSVLCEGWPACSWFPVCVSELIIIGPRGVMVQAPTSTSTSFLSFLWPENI